jgi:hypothetical protein
MPHSASFSNNLDQDALFATTVESWQFPGLTDVKVLILDPKTSQKLIRKA